jgi:hypothetical protein
MADLSSFAQTVSNAGVTVATLPANFGKHVISQSDAGRELVIKIAKTDMTDANVTAIRNAITQAGGDGTGALSSNQGDAFTIAAIGTANGAAFVSGTTDVLFMRVQGTGTFDTTDAAAGTGATVTVEAVFQPAL